MMDRTGGTVATHDRNPGPNLSQMAQFLREMTKANITPTQVAKFLSAFGLKQDK